MNQGDKVALGFECPLWIPIRSSADDLTKARRGETRSWSANAGAASLATGLAQVPWILHKIHEQAPDSKAFLDWESYQESDHGLFIWEAFVSNKKTATPHTEDAKAAASAFVKALPSPGTDITLPGESQCRSLIGAALLWAEWSSDQSLLHQRCMVIKAKAPS